MHTVYLYIFNVHAFKIIYYDGSLFVYFVVKKYNHKQNEQKITNIYVHTYTNTVLNKSNLKNSRNPTVTLPKCFKMLCDI